jgi:hypothetical protein
MDEEEEIIKLDLEELTVPRERKVRLGELKKNHLEQLSDSARKNKAPELRILNEEPEEIIERSNQLRKRNNGTFSKGGAWIIPSMKFSTPTPSIPTRWKNNGVRKAGKSCPVG